MSSLNQRINRRIAHGVVAKILEDLIVDERIDAEIPVEYEDEQAQAIAKEIGAIMNEHVALSKRHASHLGPCIAGQFGHSLMLRDGTKVCIERGENAHNAHVWLVNKPAERVQAAEGAGRGEQ